jgi:hypothetical protein
MPAFMGLVRQAFSFGRQGSMSYKSIRWLVVALYLIVGVVIAWDHGYLGLSWLRSVASALLAVFLWWLVLLGVNLHIHP